MQKIFRIARPTIGTEWALEFPEFLKVVINISNNLKYTIKYSAVHCFYWSISCSSLNFASVFLLSRHFSNGQIGLVLALANVFGVVFQPAIAAFADKTHKISMKNLAVILVGAAGVLAAARFFLSGLFWVLALLLVLELTILFTLQPLVNFLGMQMINEGVGINFGLARGLGSMAFAVLSVALGFLVEHFSTDFLPAMSTAFYVLLGIGIYTFTNKRHAKPEENDSERKTVEIKEKSEGKPDGFFSFILHNKKFCILIIAVSLTFCSHFMINNYLIQVTKNVGGTAREMGIATGLAAAIELPAMILFGFLVRKFRSSSILKYSLFFFMAKALVTLLAANVWMLYVAQMIQCSSYALFIPASIYYVNIIIKRKDMAKGQAFMTSAITLGGVAASLLGGWLLDGPGVGGMLFVGFLSSILGLIVGLFSIEKADEEKYAQVHSK